MLPLGFVGQTATQAQTATIGPQQQAMAELLQAVTATGPSGVPTGFVTGLTTATGAPPMAFAVSLGRPLPTGTICLQGQVFVARTIPGGVYAVVFTSTPGLPRFIVAVQPLTQTSLITLNTVNGQNATLCGTFLDGVFNVISVAPAT